MIFPKTTKKLQEANQQLQQLKKSTSVDDFEGHLSAFLAASDSIIDVLRTEGSAQSKTEFKQWHDLMLAELKSDPLCSFFQTYRNKSIHRGESKIASKLQITGPAQITAPPDADIEITNRGTYIVRKAGTHEEERELITIGKTSYQIQLTGTPKEHLGINIEDKNPIELCQIYKEYLERKLREAKKLASA